VEKIRIAKADTGNSASSLPQRIEYYRYKDSREDIGFTHGDMGCWKPADIEVRGDI
jgi:myo-inositol-1-phosphate synthase